MPKLQKAFSKLLTRVLEDLIIGKDVRKHANAVFSHKPVQNKIRSDEYNLPTPKIWKTPNRFIGKVVTDKNVTICVLVSRKRSPKKIIRAITN